MVSYLEHECLLKSNVARTYAGADWIGVVRAYDRVRKLFKIVYDQVPAGHGHTEELTSGELAAGIALAAELGVDAVVK